MLIYSHNNLNLYNNLDNLNLDKNLDIEWRCRGLLSDFEACVRNMKATQGENRK